MTSRTIVELLNEAAATLAPYAEVPSPGGRSWDGSRYVTHEQKPFDPIAAKWWSVLTTAAEILRLQDAPPSQRQLEYLRKILLGGMGSLVDFRVPSDLGGDSAVATNARLDQLTNAMHAWLDKALHASK